jgi:hypothetical protein
MPDSSRSAGLSCSARILSETCIRVVVASFEIVELRDDAEQLAQLRLVGDVVLREDRLGVAPHCLRERLELRVVANHVLERAVDLVGEARHVGGTVDAFAVLRDCRGGGGERDDRR